MSSASLSNDTVEDIEDCREDLRALAESDLRCSEYAESLLNVLD